MLSFSLAEQHHLCAHFHFETRTIVLSFDSGRLDTACFITHTKAPLVTLADIDVDTMENLLSRILCGVSYMGNSQLEVPWNL